MALISFYLTSSSFHAWFFPPKCTKSRSEGAVKITTPTIPVKIDQKRLAAIEDMYAKKLLVPLSFLADERPLSNGMVPSPLPIAKRRVPASSPNPTVFQTYVGVSGTEAEIQALVGMYGFVTVAQVARLLNKSENTARNKLSKLVDAGILTMSSVPRTTPSGKTPHVYSLKVKKLARSQLFLDHALATSDILITTALLPTVAPNCIIWTLQSDHTLKASPLQLPDGSILVPDGLVRLQYQGFNYCLDFEIDRNTETSREKITSKLKAYTDLASAIDCMVVAFCVVEGGDLRVKTLRNYAREVLPGAVRKLFVFASIDLPSLTPSTLFLCPLWQSVDDTTLQPLLEL